MAKTNFFTALQVGDRRSPLRKSRNSYRHPMRARCACPAAVILERSEESRQGYAFDDRGGGFCEALREYNKSQKFPYRQKRAALNAAISAFKTALFRLMYSYFTVNFVFYA